MFRKQSNDNLGEWLEVYIVSVARMSVDSKVFGWCLQLGDHSFTHLISLCELHKVVIIEIISMIAKSHFYVCQPICIDISDFTVLVALHLYFIEVCFSMQEYLASERSYSPSFLTEWVDTAAAAAGA